MAVMPYATVVGVFRDRSAADLALEALANVGFKRERMRYLVADATGGFFETLKSVFTGENPVEEHLVSNLTDMGLSGEEAQYFSDEYSQGSAILAVQTQGDEEMALNILYQYGAHNARRESSFHGWPATMAQQTPAAGPGNYVAPEDPTAAPNPEYPTTAQSLEESQQFQPVEDHSTQDHQQDEAMAHSNVEVRLQPVQPTAFGFNPEAYNIEVNPRDQSLPSSDEEATDGHVEALPQEVPSDQNTFFPQEAVLSDQDTPLPQEALSDQDTSFPQSGLETPINQANGNTPEVEGTGGYENELQGLLAQVETTKQQLQEARSQLEAIKERESRLTTTRLQLKELQAELQATQEELQATRLRMSA